MWILKFLPNWIFSLMFFLGIAGYLVTKTIKILPQAKLIQYASIGLVFFSTYMSGAISDNDTWLKKVAELEKKVLVLEAEAAKVNTDIVRTLANKKEQRIDTKQQLIQYIDREVIKYDETCKIPKEVVDTLNKAAK